MSGLRQEDFPSEFDWTDAFMYIETNNVALHKPDVRLYSRCRKDCRELIVDNAIDVIVDVARKLDSASIRYMVRGSMAANIYAEPRFTNDVDIVIELPAQQKHTLLLLFGSDYYITSEAVADAFAGLGMVNIIHNQQMLKCDLIILKRDSFSQASFSRRSSVELRGYPVSVISVEDLVLQKLLWRKETGSEQQLDDVKRILAVQREALDTVYCDKWAAELGVREELGKML